MSLLTLLGMCGKPTLAESAAEHTRLRTDNYELLSKLTTAEMKIAELETKHKADMETIFRAHDADTKDYELRIIELEKDAARLKQFTVWADSGLCPALVFNDNGYWAISFDGVIPMDFSEPPNDAQLLIDVEKSMWRETVAEAIDQAITNTGDKT